MNQMDDIASFLDAENSVTAKWLANSLNVNLDGARSALAQYKAARADVSASYLLVGESLRSTWSFVVASSANLDTARASFTTVHSEELYSLHKLQSESNVMEIQVLEHEQASELMMMSHPSSTSFFKNTSGYICCPGIDVKPIGQRILSNSHVRNEPAVAPAQVVKSTLAKVAAEKHTEAPAPAVLKSKSSIQAASFFGAAVVKAEKPAAATAPTAASAPSSAASTMEEEKSTTQKRVGKIAVDDEDEEWDSGYKPNAARLKERVDPAAALRKDFSVGATEEEEDGNAAIAEDLTLEEDGVAGKEAGKRRQKAAVVLRGAMDDYMEDAAIAEHNRAAAAPADAPRPKKRKLVEKMFADEKGYLVTSMVWEEVSDDEGAGAVEPEPVKRQKGTEAGDKENGDLSAANREKKAPAPGSAAAKPKKAAAPAAGQQKSMMSFFGKKA